MGVWIEIQNLFGVFVVIIVTPLVGVWIEIIRTHIYQRPHRSLPLWECGLKSCWYSKQCKGSLSLPLWECGLKSQEDLAKIKRDLSLPLWECGLKYTTLAWI